MGKHCLRLWSRGTSLTGTQTTPTVTIRLTYTPYPQMLGRGAESVSNDNHKNRNWNLGRRVEQSSSVTPAVKSYRSVSAAHGKQILRSPLWYWRCLWRIFRRPNPRRGQWTARPATGVSPRPSPPSSSLPRSRSSVLTALPESDRLPTARERARRRSAKEEGERRVHAGPLHPPSSCRRWWLDGWAMCPCVFLVLSARPVLLVLRPCDTSTQLKCHPWLQSCSHLRSYTTNEVVLGQMMPGLLLQKWLYHWSGRLKGRKAGRKIFLPIFEAIHDSY